MIVRLRSLRLDVAVDDGLNDAPLLKAVARGVEVGIITPGQHNNHTIARLASRRHYGELLVGGVHIIEYQPGMIHSKIMLVDRLWSVVGSTNFDNRSFGLNNEVNLLLRDAGFAMTLEKTTQDYQSAGHEITLAEWVNRPLLERVLAFFGSILERQE